MVALDPRSALRSLVGLSVGSQRASDDEARPTHRSPLHPCCMPCSDWALGSTWLDFVLPGCCSFLSRCIYSTTVFSAPDTQSQARWMHGGSGSKQHWLLQMLHDGVLGPIREDHTFRITACFHFSFKFYDTTVSNFRRQMGSKRLPVSRGAGTESPVRNLGGRSWRAAWRRWHFSWASRCEQDWVMHRREQ